MENIEIDIVNLRESLNNKLVNSGWDKMLSPYINGLDFDVIMNTLVQNVNMYSMHYMNAHMIKLK